jgi:methylmalonyl-CoA mutase
MDQTDPTVFAKPAPDVTLPGKPETCVPLTPHRDAEPFEALRARASALKSPPRAILITVGDPAAAGARIGFVRNLLTAGGVGADIATLAGHERSAASLFILCGTDAAYEAQAADKARTLKAAGARQVWLAGRPGALEPTLGEAGVDDFIFAGCDIVAKLDRILTELER